MSKGAKRPRSEAEPSEERAPARVVPKWGVALGWHCLAWEELAALVSRAEALGYDTAYIDGDVSQLGVRREADVLDGWTATTALIARTPRIQIASIRLVQHWNAAHLAQVMATAERIAPGRCAFFASIGDRPEDRAWGMTPLPASERAVWLDETLDAVRALWRGETVTRHGRFVQLEQARVRPVPPGGIPIEIAAKSERLLAVVARHADIWNVNWPAIPARVDASAEALAAACRRVGRAPGAISRRMWIYTRTQALSGATALAEFRRWNPWFGALSDAELAPALVVGPPAECRQRLAELARELRLEMPVIDLSGLDADAALETLESLPAGEIN
jgi:alkanesulfonate monooxygenase SsuD/methylene tetrahydromethanopterin reductase-like flavin-dependent oxidoreductase (luciferase family)